MSQFLQVPTIVLLCATTLTGCMVGPNFHSPKPTQTKSYTESPAVVKTVSIPRAGKAGKTQYFVRGKDIPAKWWTLFHSPEINQLVCMGLVNSPNLAAAKATLRQAKDNLSAQIGSTMLPAVGGQFTGTRERFSPASFGVSGGSALGNNFTSLFNLYNASVTVTYTLDVFGGLRRQIEALAAQVDYEKYEVDATYLTLTSNIVTAAITAASLQAQIQATHELIRSQASQLTIVKRQFNLGGASRADVFSQETQLEQTRATLPPLAQSLSQTMHLLSVLIGELPSESQLPKLSLDKISLPTQLPISVPSSLARQRPDILASEALLHAASAEVGVATANMFPQINLTGNYGRESLILSNLFNARNVVWNYGGSLLQPIFNGGALLARRRAAIAGFEQARAQYCQTVLQAFQNVADTLRALEHDAQAFKAQKSAEVAARNSLLLTQKQFELGGVNYISLLTAERQYQQTRISRIQAQASRYTDTAALFQALGGGWWSG